MKFRLLAFFICSFIILFAQDDLWRDHLPYNSVNDIAVRGNEFFCATNQGMFRYDDIEQEITTYSKSNLLSDIGITSLAYNAKNDLIIIGYRNANIDLMLGEQVFNMSDIRRASQFLGRQRINHITTSGDFAWFSTGFGIVQINLALRVVTATYIIGPNGSELEVFQTAIDEVNNRMYAATPLGLYSADLSDPLIFFQSWQSDPKFDNKRVNKTATLQGKVFANKETPNSPDDSVFYNDGTGWKYLDGQGLNKKYQLRTENGFICIVNPFTVNYLTPDLNLKYVISNAWFQPGTFLPRCGFMLPDGRTMLIGNEQYGLIKSVNVELNFRILPNGPASSDCFAVAAEDNKVYVAPGAIDGLWTRQFQNKGIFEMDDFTWKWIEPDDINNIGDVVNVLIDPTDKEQFYAAAWGTGILKLKNGQLVEVYDYNTSGGILQGPTQDLLSPRTGGIAFDMEGNLWVSCSQSETPLAVKRKDGTWQNFSAGSLGGSSTNVFKVAVNQLNQKWVQTRSTGLLVMDDTDGNVQWRAIRSGVGNGNLPSNIVLSFAESLDGEMWIGTNEGLVVLYSPQNIFRAGRNYDAQPVLFEEDGVVQRLMGTEAVTAIAIDGANKKWFGTQNSGVFYTSADGTETIYKFTAENSPLLSNNILSIGIDNVTGVVYFATEEGIVSFRGSATRGYDEYTDVFAYPNPVRPGYDGPIFIKGLVTNARVKITDVAGNIVFETIAEGGQARWDGYTLDGQAVRSGVYMAYISDDLAERTHITKILVIR